MTVGPQSFKTLKRFLKEVPDTTEFAKVAAELEGDNDRASAILGAALLDDVLSVYFRAEFIHLNETEFDELVGQDRPLGSFSGRVKTAYAIRGIGKIARDDLECIREIRNAFAHGTRHLLFETKEVRVITERLNYPKRFISELTRPADTPKLIFISTVRLLATKIASKARYKLKTLVSANNLSLADALEGVPDVP